MTGDEIYKKVYPKSAFEQVLSEGGHTHGQILKGHQELEDAIIRIASSMGEAWDSEGASAAKEEMNTLQNLSSQVSDGLPDTQSSYADEMGAHRVCRTSLQACGQEPAKASWWGRQSWLPGGTTQEELDAKHDEQERHNVQQYNQFTGHSETNETRIYQQYPAVHTTTAAASTHDKTPGVDPTNTHSSDLNGGQQTSPSNATGTGTSSGPGSAYTPSGSTGGTPSGSTGSHSNAPSSGPGSAYSPVSHPSSPSGGSGSSSGAGPSVPRSTPPSTPHVDTAPAASSSGAPSSGGEWSGDGYRPSSVPSGSTSAAGYADPALSSTEGVGGAPGATSGFGPVGSGNTGRGGGAGAGMGMMPPPMMGGVGMGAGGGDQIRSGGGYGPGLGGGPGAGSRSGVGSFGPEGSGSSTSSPTSAARGGMGAPMGAGAGRGKKSEDEEHQDDYYMDTQMEDGITQKDENGEYVIDPVTGMMVPPPVIGE